MASNAKRMWLHDENDTITVLPYTTLDNIKIQPNQSEDTFIDFENDYNNVKSIIASNKNSVDADVRRIENEIDQLELQISSAISDTATSSSNGLMSKEDKVKLDNIANSANNYVLPQATTSSLGGIKVDGTTTTIDNNGVLHAAGSGGGSVDALSDVVISGLMDEQFLQYDFTAGKWKNKTFSIDEIAFDYITEAQINSLFPEPPEVVSFNTGTDEQIAAIINAYYNGLLTLEQIQEIWHIGDTRNINIEAIAASGGSGDTVWSVGESHRAQTVTIQILDFNHDDLTTSVNGKIKALITVDLKNCLRDSVVSDTDGSNNTENGYINSSNTNTGGWMSCDRRKWCNNGFYNALPLYIKNLVKPVNKLTSEGNQSSTIVTTSDYVFLTSEIEALNKTDNSFTGEGTVYTYYNESISNRIKLPVWNNTLSTTVSCIWWGRSPGKYSPSAFCFVGATANGGLGTPSSDARGIAPVFCM